MNIDYNILRAYGGVAKKVAKDELIFEEGTMPRFFYQVIEGEVILFCSNTDGKELIQGLLTEGKSFGEPSLFLEKPYSNSARAVKDSVIVIITKDKLMNIFRDYPDMPNVLIRVFAEQVHYQSSLFKIWVNPIPEEKIVSFLEVNYPKKDVAKRIEIPLTRQQIANYTGLRVETVIRTLVRMKEENKVEIINRKLFY
ncbi:MAG TPA: Crp/Fnr family transcriptional regulator [Crocinitomicaceae bacterium]|nr:Crp/Fnr family transcriptional regulator [Crocinitomicaceae bacterium]